jgi:K+-sensing histidine kinase KdpD
MRRAGLFFVPQMRPWSWQAFVLGFAVVAVATAVQGVCVLLGAELYFAAFLPGIFAVGMLAGIPAAAFAILLTIPLVWWAFMPPFFEFSALTSTYAHDINLFFLFGVLLTGLGDLCRLTMAITGRGSPSERAVPNAQ